MNNNDSELKSDDLRKTAIHEAGHVVAMIRLGVEHAFATLVRSEDWAGYVQGEGRPEKKSGAEAQTTAHCAGYAACVVAGFGEERASEGCGNDFDKAQDLIDFWQMGSLTDWQTKAVEFMSRPENVRAVDILAAHLLKHTTLEAEYLSVLISVADGETTEAEFERYLIIRGPVDMAELVEQFR
jgi:hypothetical protein